MRGVAPRLTQLGLLAVLVATLSNLGLLNLDLLVRGAGNIAVFVAAMFPPNLAVLERVSWALLETLQIAYVGTALGAVLALPMAFLATGTLFGPRVTAPTRFALAFVRTIPALLWGIVFVVAVGLGPAAGALGIGLYTLGYLGKLFYEIFEGVDPEVLEAVRGVGCNRLQLARFAVLPEAANGVLAQLLFMFEYNVRASSIMGFVGAGGVGYYMLGYIQLLRYDALMTAILVTLVVVLFIDWLSRRIRGLFIQPANVGE
ncbi:MAG: phosphonate ABC transporter, permease protein PhnE [Dehalococcoidia bacterium]|nr:phosphonate ABC transporter, permease protein PhnE [Dehalococcoidia bacterium]